MNGYKTHGKLPAQAMGHRPHVSKADISGGIVRPTFDLLMIHIQYGTCLGQNVTSADGKFIPGCDLIPKF
jgi:hypothetical protein